MTLTRPRRIAALTGAAGLALALTAPAAMAAGDEEGAPYSDIELQARTNLLVNDEGYHLPPGSSFNSISPDINDDGDVAFRVQYTADADPTIGRPGIWSGGHGEGEIAYTGEEDWLVPNDPSINAGGDIAFTLSSGSVDNKLWLYEAGTGEASQVATAPIMPNSYGTPQLDDEGRIMFLASYSDGDSYGAYIDGEGVVYASTDRVDPDSPYTYFYTPAANESAQIAGKVSTSTDLSSELEVRLFSSDGTSELLLANDAVDPASPYTKFENSLALNDEGVIAVVATRAEDGAKVLIRTDGESVTEIAEAGAGGDVAEFDSFRPSINNAGQVAFRAVDDDGQAIYVGDGETLTRVIGKGDVVETDLGTAQLGQHDASPVFGGAPTINNSGDIVFTAGVHPEGDKTVEWGTGVFVAYAGDGDGEDPGPDPDPEEASQDIVVTVPEQGGGEPGSLVISVDPEDHTVELPEMGDDGDRLSTQGELRPVTVTDSRQSDPGWDASAQVSEFTSEDDAFSGGFLGWSPLVGEVSDGQSVTPGEQVDPGFPTGDGLSVPRGLASAGAGAGLGTAQLGAGLQLQVPTDTTAGQYRAVLTLTAI